MDHQIAVRDKLAERYLLNELSDQDRDNFEEHYFICDQCAEDVRLGATFVANAKAVLRDEPGSVSERADPRPVRSWLQWIWNPLPAYALAGALAVTAVVQRSTVSPALQPQFVAATELRPATRGTPQVLRVGPDQASIQLTAGVPVGAAYAVTITNSAGEVIASVDTPVLQSPQLSLLLPADRLRAGRFTLTVRSRDGVAQPFHEQFEFTTQP